MTVKNPKGYLSTEFSSSYLGVSENRGILIIRILLFTVLNEVSLFSETPTWGIAVFRCRVSGSRHPVSGSRYRERPG